MVANAPRPPAAGSYEDGPVGNSRAGSLFPRAARHKQNMSERPCLAPGQPPAARWTAILLAEERRGSGVSDKALIRTGGRTLLRRAVDTLLAAPEIQRIVILAQQPDALMVDDAADLALHPRVSLAVSRDGIASSISAIAGSALAPFPLLMMKVDHALTPAVLTEFLSATGDCDVAVGVRERSVPESEHPEKRRSWLRYSDGRYSGVSLFALHTPEGRAALGLWESLEQDGKRMWKLFARSSPRLLVRALSRSIDFPQAVTRAGQRFSLRAKPVVLSTPEAAIDVDKLSDLELAGPMLARREGAQRV